MSVHVGVLKNKLWPVLMAISLLVPIVSGLTRPLTVGAHAPTIAVDPIADPTFDVFPQTINVTGTITHVSGQSGLNPVSDISLYVDDVYESVQIIPNASGDSFDYSLPWEIFGSGTYELTVVAIHGSAREEQSVQVVVIDSSDEEPEDPDQEAPNTTLTPELDGTFWNTPISIEGTTTDNISVATVNLFAKPAGADDSKYVLIDTLTGDQTTSFDWTYLWTPDKEGSYDIKAAGVDLAGNEETSAFALDVTYDITNPLVNAGLDQTITDLLTATLSGSFTDANPDPNDVVWTLINGPAATFDNSTTLTTGVEVTVIGVYEFMLSVMDAAGNIGFDTVVITFEESGVVAGDQTTNNNNTNNQSSSSNNNQSNNSNNNQSFVSFVAQGSTDDEENIEDDGEVLQDVDEDEPLIEFTTTSQTDDDPDSGWPNWLWWLLWAVIGLSLARFFFLLFKRRGDEDEQ